MPKTETFTADFCQCPACHAGQFTLVYKFEKDDKEPKMLAPECAMCVACNNSNEERQIPAIGISYPVMRMNVNLAGDKLKVGDVVSSPELVAAARRLLGELRGLQSPSTPR